MKKNYYNISYPSPWSLEEGDTELSTNTDQSIKRKQARVKLRSGSAGQLHGALLHKERYVQTSLDAGVSLEIKAIDRGKMQVRNSSQESRMCG